MTVDKIFKAFCSTLRDFDNELTPKQMWSLIEDFCDGMYSQSTAHLSFVMSMLLATKGLKNNPLMTFYKKKYLASDWKFKKPWPSNNLKYLCSREGLSQHMSFLSLNKFFKGENLYRFYKIFSIYLYSKERYRDLFVRFCLNQIPHKLKHIDAIELYYTNSMYYGKEYAEKEVKRLKEIYDSV